MTLPSDMPFEDRGHASKPSFMISGVQGVNDWTGRINGGKYAYYVPVTHGSRMGRVLLVSRFQRGSRHGGRA